MFYTLGLSVRNFLLGTFGVYAYVFVIHLVMMGVALVSGRFLVPKGKRGTAFYVRVILGCILLLVHLFVSFNGSFSFADELSYAYSAPASSGTTVAGALGSLIILPVSLLVSKVGAIIFYFLVLILLLAFIFRRQIAKLFVSAEKRSSSDKKSKKSDGDGAEDGAQPSVEQRAPVRNFFFNEKSGFGFRNKREVAEMPDRRLEPFRGRFEQKTIIDVARREAYGTGRVGGGSYDRQRPEEFTQSSSPFSPDRSVKFSTNGSPMGFTDTSDVPEKVVSVSDYDNVSSSKDVYTIPMSKASRDGGRAPDGVRPERNGFSRGGIFDGGRADTADTYGAPTRADERLFSDTDRGNTSNGFSNDTYSAPKTGVGDTPGYEERRTEVRSIPAEPKKSAHDAPADQEPITQSKVYNPFTAAQPVAPQQTVTPTGQPTASPVKTAFEPKEDFVDDTYEEDGYSFIPQMPLNYKYIAPKIDLLTDYTPNEEAQWEERRRQEFCKQKIVSVFKTKNIDVEIVNIVSGSTVTRFDVAVPDDVSLSEINNLKNDLAFRLKTKGEFRMNSIPGTDLIGIEVASEARRTVGMKSVFSHKNTRNVPFDKGMYFMLGEDVLGAPIYLNLMAMPHLLVCGATGTGKSVCLNTLLISLMFRYGPDELRFIIVDPKKVEFKAFESIPHLVFDAILGLDENGKATKAIAVLEWAVQEMERRYNFLADLGLKDIKQYNKQINPKTDKKIPYIVILIDEFADFLMSSPESRKAIEISVGRLAQKARAAGISLIMATQRPSADVIAGNIKTNIPSRICFKTSTAVDSRVVLETNGAECLLSKGDCYYKTTEDSSLHRSQGALICDDDIKKVVDYIKERNKCYFDNSILDKINREAAKIGAPPEEEEELPSPKSQQGGGRMVLDPSAADDVTKRAIRIAIVTGSISTSGLRTYLRIGYNRANSVVLWMQRMQYITAPLENQSRRTLITKEQYEQIYGEFVEDF